jgi:CBS domain-containing protein/anti-sigma regulatory factor (Ser/Thr protein kinase)
MQDDLTRAQEILYELRVEEVMTREVITVTPQTSMRELEEILRVHRISGTPVLKGGELVGVISLMDLIQALEAGKIHEQVGQHMTRQVDALRGDERVISAAGKLEQTGYGRFPVVDRATGKLVGILTRGDIIKGTLRRLDVDYRQRESERYGVRHFFQDIVSEDTSIILRYTVRALDFDRGGEASSRLKRSLQNLGILPQALRRVAIASYEAEMNLILHATDGGKIRAEVSPGVVYMEVSDCGPGIPDVAQALQPGFSTAPEWIREMGFGAGMGLTNIQNCADEMTLESQVGEGTVLRMFFRTGAENR